MPLLSLICLSPAEVCHFTVPLATNAIFSTSYMIILKRMRQNVNDPGESLSPNSPSIIRITSEYLQWAFLSRCLFRLSSKFHVCNSILLSQMFENIIILNNVLSDLNVLMQILFIMKFLFLSCILFLFCCILFIKCYSLPLLF